jgi:hypothetical protein
LSYTYFAIGALVMPQTVFRYMEKLVGHHPDSRLLHRGHRAAHAIQRLVFLRERFLRGVVRIEQQSERTVLCDG